MSKHTITLTLKSDSHKLVATIAQENDLTLAEAAEYLLMKGLAHHADNLPLTYHQAVQKISRKQSER